MNRIARRLGAASLLLAMSGVSIAAVAPADALAKKCVSKKEYRAISKGQTMHKVHKILDGQKVFFGYDLGTEALEQYETCGWSQKYVTVEYGGGLPPTVTSKALKPFQGGTS